ncbi:HlyD family type I secretion periplasmic adaptor subunit [Sedimentitalea todarodis]|uniref:Membrane fusion protein (MFP) family protein n=1 Tax=Sedimentitalea todarodis TaxID=1631240 RepID=A0ABU3VLQ9_9RHOB|nr:HlyD family type I secretion periplasmic adaptor subunit [Sedimentitalea todarodis]MDU9007127.1 HlyD family type I secretion periplasmic adaptor subunit [Sedimentitalea todarodis]
MSTSITPRRTTDPSLPDRLFDAAPQVAAPPTRIGFLVLTLVLMCAGFWGGLGMWAATAPLKSAVIAIGSFRVDGNLPSVQHLEGGLIRKVRVAEGEQVRKGQVLVELETVMSTAQDRILLNQLVNALAQDSRLAAEFAEADAITYSDELALMVENYPPFRELAQTQHELFRSNSDLWHGQAAILEERVDELRQQLNGQITRKETIEKRLDIVETDLADIQGLFDKGLVTKTRYTARRENQIALEGDLGMVASQIEGVRQRISETKERILQIRRERAMRISSERQAVKQQIFDIRQRLVANEDVRERSLVRAPVTGRVIGLKVAAPGEVVLQGQEILRIVPKDAVYLAEGRVRPSDVEEVKEGLEARVRLTAYNFRTTPPVEGFVSHVSADSMTDPNSGLQYYLVKVQVSEDALEALPDVELQAGMPAQIMITTGEQTVADYVLGPLMAGAETALRESN